MLELLQHLSNSTLIWLVLSFVKLDRRLLMKIHAKELEARQDGQQYWLSRSMDKDEDPRLRAMAHSEASSIEESIEAWRSSNWVEAVLAQLGKNTPTTPTRKPYGYEIKVALAPAALVRFDVAPCASTTLLRTGTEESVRAWALTQKRELNGRSLQVVGVEGLKPLDQAEYQAKLKEKRGW